MSEQDSTYNEEILPSQEISLEALHELNDKGIVVVNPRSSTFMGTVGSSVQSFFSRSQDMLQQGRDTVGRIALPAVLAMAITASACGGSNEGYTTTKSHSTSESSPTTLVSPTPGADSLPLISTPDTQPATPRSSYTATPEPTAIVTPTPKPAEQVATPTPEATPSVMTPEQIIKDLPYPMKIAVDLQKGKDLQYLSIIVGVGEGSGINNITLDTKDFPDAANRLQGAILITLLNMVHEQHPDLKSLTMDEFKALIVSGKAPELTLGVAYEGKSAGVKSSNLSFNYTTEPIIIATTDPAKYPGFQPGEGSGEFADRVVGGKVWVMEIGGGAPEQNFFISIPEAAKNKFSGLLASKLTFQADNQVQSGGLKGGEPVQQIDFNTHGGADILNDLIPSRQGSGINSDWTGILQPS